MRVRDMTDGLDPVSNALGGNERANHKNDQAIWGQTKIASAGSTWRKKLAIDAVWNKSATPTTLVPFKKFGVGAHQTLASEEPIFGRAGACWPIAILSDEYMGWTNSS
jgi:hypothetical protein